MKNIRIYTTHHCPYCILAKNLLTSLGVNYEEINIQTLPGGLQELVEKTHMRTVPQIFVGDIFLRGYTDILELHQQGKLKSILGI